MVESLTPEQVVGGSIPNSAVLWPSGNPEDCFSHNKAHITAKIVSVTVPTTKIRVLPCCLNISSNKYILLIGKRSGLVLEVGGLIPNSAVLCPQAKTHLLPEKYW